MMHGGVMGANLFGFPDQPHPLPVNSNPNQDVALNLNRGPGLPVGLNLDHGLLPLEALFGSDEFRMYCFKVKLCSVTRSHDWTECPFAHRGEKARRRDPRRFNYLAIGCPLFRNGECPRGDGCDFAHGVFEYWLHPARYRTRPCNAGPFCRRKVCFFAHTPHQLRAEAKYGSAYIFPIVLTNGSDQDGSGEDAPEPGSVESAMLVLERARSAPQLGVPGDDPDEVVVGLDFLRSLRRLKLGPAEPKVDRRAGSEISDLDLPHVGWVSELIDG